MNDWAEIRHFRYLVEIMKRGGVRPAAEFLHTSPPNLCTQANEFQEHFNIHLYQKGADGRLSYTETGVAFLAIAPADEIASGEIDAALVTLPAEHPELCIEELRRDRLVACIRADHPLAVKVALRPADLHDQLRIFYHKKIHAEAHAKLMEQLREVGVRVGDYSSASHPSEMQQLVKEGFGLTLMREGTPLESELTTRPILGVDWTVETAFVYHKKRHPETIPVLVRHLKRHFATPPQKPELSVVPTKVRTQNRARRRPPQSEDKGARTIVAAGLNPGGHFLYDQFVNEFLIPVKSAIGHDD